MKIVDEKKHIWIDEPFRESSLVHVHDQYLDYITVCIYWMCDFYHGRTKGMIVKCSVEWLVKVKVLMSRHMLHL
jgi:hypothetical protein